MKRRQLLASTLGLLGLSPHSRGTTTASRARVVVVGGGFGGATAAKYIRMLSDYSIEVVLVEPGANFISCPMSNLVLGGVASLANLTHPYETLVTRHGVKHVREMAQRIDVENKTVRLASGTDLAYDRLIVSPGVDFLWGRTEGLQAAHQGGQILHAWKAGAETLELARQLHEMPDGGVYAITVPMAPYRCPPGPYERASQVASYFRKAKPRSKVLVFDANPDVTSKGALFKRFWAEHFAGMLEYLPNHTVVSVDGRRRAVQFDLHPEARADVLNVLPDMSAGRIAVDSGLANANGRWCNVDYLSFESTAARNVHVIGDSLLAAPFMPKSGHMANAQAKVAAAAVVAYLCGLEVNAQPLLTNTCYSMLDDRLAIHVASVHQYAAQEKTYRTVPGSGGLSAAPSELEGHYAWSWAHNIWADTLA